MSKTKAVKVLGRLVPLFPLQKKGLVAVGGLQIGGAIGPAWLRRVWEVSAVLLSRGMGGT